MGRRFLGERRARAYYDRFGSKQDAQAFYEDEALSTLATTARYHGCDLSGTMVRLASERLQGDRERALVVQAALLEGLPFRDGSCDRFLSTYVLDLLPEVAVTRALDEAHRVLVPGGLLCLAGVSPGTTTVSRFVMGVWSLAHRLEPWLVGGCRPLAMRRHLGPDRWSVEHHEIVVSWGVASEILVAARSPDEVAGETVGA